jgi:iron complex outermembrane recepter protein
MTLQRWMLLIGLALGVVLCGVPARAQTPDARIGGVVRDAAGVALPGVTITVTSQATNASRTTVTVMDGNFSIVVEPGTYSVSASLTGYRKVTQTVVVPAGASSQLDLTLVPTISEEITVTAMKREELVLDVPFSVAAPTEQELRDRGVEDFEGVAANVAGLTVQNLGPGQSQVSMRGVSSGQIVRDQPGVKEQVGIYLDESPISMSLFTPDVDLVDVSRVEVLRGPQGTLFGSGSLSGTVRYISNPPMPGVTEGSVELGVSGIDGGSAGGNAKLVLNLPVGEKTAVRVASYFTRIGGYIDAVQPDLSLNENVNDGMRTGVRAAVLFAPNDRLSITPRIVYQRSEMDGWNRIDAFNILANPFTTTRPAVTLGERQQFTQLEEKYTDDFVLGDLNISYDLGGVTLTSVTSYVHRDVLVIRDATALTASITGGSIGLPEAVYALDAPLIDATTADVWSQELRFSGGQDRFRWVGGAFYRHTARDYGQDLPVLGFESLTGIPTRGLLAPRDTLYYSELSYKLGELALFGEGTLSLTDRLDVTLGLRYYNFNEDKEQIFDGLFANDDTGTGLVSQPGSTDASGLAPRLILAYKLSDAMNVNAQVSRGFRLGGINDPINVPLCTPQDLVTFGNRETWKDETVWNYEAGLKTRLLGGNGTFSVSAFHMDISDLQATVTAGSCSSRVIFNVPKAQSRGLELELEASPSRNFDFAVSSSFTDPELRTTLLSTEPGGGVSVVSGIEEGRRLPTVPKFQLAASATYNREVARDSILYLTGTYQHIGSRFTQVGDEDLGTLNLLSFGPNTPGGPLTANVFTYDPELPAYDIVNLRVGLRRNRWEVAAYVNNLTDELALLAFDQERGTRARVGYLTNQPRTFGLMTRFDF